MSRGLSLEWEFRRVFNWNPAVVNPDQNGHPFYVWPHKGAGRVDNPDYAYQVLYVRDSPEGVMAKAFGRFARWTPWWSYYDPQWSSFGLWELGELRLAADPEVIELENDAVISAASSIRRVIDERRAHARSLIPPSGGVSSGRRWPRI